MKPYSNRKIGVLKRAEGAWILMQFSLWRILLIAILLVYSCDAFQLAHCNAVSQVVSETQKRSLPLTTPRPCQLKGKCRAVLHTTSLLDHDPTTLATTTVVKEIPAAFDEMINIALSFPAVWSLSIMVALVSLLYGWETFVETVREKIPRTFLPVFEKMWAEVAGLGFIGLFLQVIIHPLEPLLGHLSERYLGEEDILMETFEFLHSAFFQVGIAFFTAVAYQVAVSLRNIESLEYLERIGLNEYGECTATPSRLADILNAPSLPYKEAVYSDEDVINLVPRTSIWEEITLSTEKRSVQSLLVGSYLIDRGLLPPKSTMNSVLEFRFSELLFELVELSPLTWLSLMPALALANSVDLSHDVVNSASPNALQSAGYFFSSPEALVPSAAIVSFSIIWGLINFWKLSEIKSMVLPVIAQLEFDNSTSAAILAPPRYRFPSEIGRFSSSPFLLAAVESVFSSVETHSSGNKVNEVSNCSINSLYGDARGPEFYVSSLRFHTWLCITSIVFFGTQILPRDVQAIVENKIAITGDPAHVIPEFITYSIFVFASFGLLALSPTTFLNLSLSSCFIAEFRKLDLKEEHHLVATEDQNSIMVDI